MKQNSDAVQGSTQKPLMQATTARRLFAGTLIFMALIQVVLFAKIGNGLSPFDSFDEADAVRSAEAYAKHGFTVYHGLPRTLYGNRFANVGALDGHLDSNGMVRASLRMGYPERMSNPSDWVYMHYPPGPNLLCGVLARWFGMERLWLWRLVPLTLAFISVIIFYRSMASAFGPDRSAWISLACALLPMANTYIPGLHFEGYTYSFQLLALSLLIQWLWLRRVSIWRLAALFFLGFLQGWLSFDVFFVISFAVVPLWLMRRAEGAAPPVRWLWAGIALPLIGFGFAHFLHLLQVVGELGSLRAGIAEFTSTARDRAGIGAGMEHFSYIQSFTRMSYLYVREFLRLYNQHFGPFLPLAIIAGLLLVCFRNSQFVFFPRKPQAGFTFSMRWPGPYGVGLTLLSALIVCLMWPIAMPGANIGNFHIYPRDFFLLYFVLVVATVRSISFSRTPLPK